MVRRMVIALLLVIFLDIQSAIINADPIGQAFAPYNQYAMVGGYVLPPSEITFSAGGHHGDHDSGEFSLDGRIQRPGRRDTQQSGAQEPGGNMDDEYIPEEETREI